MKVSDMDLSGRIVVRFTRNEVRETSDALDVFASMLIAGSHDHLSDGFDGSARARSMVGKAEHAATVRLHVRSSASANGGAEVRLTRDELSGLVDAFDAYAVAMLSEAEQAESAGSASRASSRLGRATRADTAVSKLSSVSKRALLITQKGDVTYAPRRKDIQTGVPNITSTKNRSVRVGSGGFDR